MDMETTILDMARQARQASRAMGACPGEKKNRVLKTMAALLDHLGLDQVAVVGVSAGGGTVYETAARHADRVAALIPVDCVARAYQPPVTDLELKVFVSPLGLRLTALLGDYLTKSAVKGMIATESTLDKKLVAERVKHITSDPLKLAYFKAMMHTLGDNAVMRVPGAKNDVEKLGAVTALPLADIRCPTLVIHGDADNDVHPDHTKLAAETIPGAEMVWIEKGSHFGFWLADEAQGEEVLGRVDSLHRREQ